MLAVALTESCRGVGFVLFQKPDDIADAPERIRDAGLVRIVDRSGSRLNRAPARYRNRRADPNWTTTRCSGTTLSRMHAGGADQS